MALAIGGAVGLLNGYMVAKRRVSAVIVSLAVSIILVGLVQFLSSGKPPGDVPKYMNEIFDLKLGPIPLPGAVLAGLHRLMWLALQRSVYGRYVEAVGESTSRILLGRAGRADGDRGHVLAGLIAAVAALVQTGSIAVGSVRGGAGPADPSRRRHHTWRGRLWPG